MINFIKGFIERVSGLSLSLVAFILRDTINITVLDGVLYGKGVV